jgi:hypothetical protein
LGRVRARSGTGGTLQPGSSGGTEVAELPLPLSEASTEKSESQQLWCVSGVSAFLISRAFSQQNCCKWLVETKSVSSVC